MSACLSVPTLEEKAWRATEPHTPHPRARLEAVAELNRLGIPTGILIAPLMPGINDAPEQVRRIVELATEAGAVHIGGQTLFLRGSVKEIFFDWLREHRPDLLERYERLYAERRVPAGGRAAHDRARGRRSVGAARVREPVPAPGETAAGAATGRSCGCCPAREEEVVPPDAGIVVLALVALARLELPRYAVGAELSLHRGRQTPGRRRRSWCRVAAGAVRRRPQRGRARSP